MQTTTAVQLSIQMTSVEGQLSGSVTDEHGRRHGFTSWLGLLALLESARRRALA